MQPTHIPGFFPRLARKTLDQLDLLAAGTPNNTRSCGSPGGPHHPRKNQRGVTFDRRFDPYLAGVCQVTVIDAYIRMEDSPRP